MPWIWACWRWIWPLLCSSTADFAFWFCTTLWFLDLDLGMFIGRNMYESCLDLLTWVRNYTKFWKNRCSPGYRFYFCSLDDSVEFLNDLWMWLWSVELRNYVFLCVHYLCQPEKFLYRFVFAFFSFL
jgi:hypothetical protein